jgi:hypothetical protein
MSKLLSAFAALDDFSGLYCAERGPLRCTAIRLRTGGLCLFSPVQGLGDTAIASLAALGEVEALLAPNHYHNKGLREYADAFPKSLICASDGAAPRLQRVTRMRFASLDKLRPLLPRTTKLVSPAGLKTGEVWASIRGTRARAWVVVDAFCGNDYAGATEPSLLATFPRFGVADRAIYVAWLERQIERDKPTVVVPCHGALVRSRRLAASIRHLVASKL